MTPTAYLTNDSSIKFGATLFNKKYQIYSKYKNHVATAFVNIGYLPRVELLIRITRQIDADYTAHVMDRMFSAKINLLKEGPIVPEFTLGLQNPYSTLESANHFNSTYFVLSKKVDVTDILKIDFSLGRGFDWIKAADHMFIGYFGGSSLNFGNNINCLSVMFENDSQKSNIGVGIKLMKYFYILYGFEGFKVPSAMVSLNFDLK